MSRKQHPTTPNEFERGYAEFLLKRWRDRAPSLAVLVIRELGERIDAIRAVEHPGHARIIGGARAIYDAYRQHPDREAK